MRDCIWCNECEKWIISDDINEEGCGVCGENNHENKVVSCLECDRCRQLFPSDEVTVKNACTGKDGEHFGDNLCPDCIAREEYEADIRATWMY